MELIAGGMLYRGTPIEDYRERYGLWVKREDLACPLPGPPFSKARGVYFHVLARPEKVIGVLDTCHSQAGWAVARACRILGKRCINFYPRYKADRGLRQAQMNAGILGAELRPLPAGRSCILFHQARKDTEVLGGYMMPNALKLSESVAETALEVRIFAPRTLGTGLMPVTVLIPASSGTIAAGVIKGLGAFPQYLVHLGYDRSESETRAYLAEMSGVRDARVTIINEKYAYKDKAKPGETPPWPCNEYYDLKAFRWWLANRREEYGETLFWNIG